MHALYALLVTLPLAQSEPDYSAELPRIAPLEPAASLATIEAVPGFRVELVASEPQIADPVSLSFDEHGRLHVVCMRGYSEQADENLGEVRRLEDTDGDGRYETSTTFARGLSWPTGIICARGGVYIAVAPDILFMRDTDGDGRADERRVVFTGFGRSNVQGLLNSLRWGIDNRVHGATSSSGGRVSSPLTDAAPVELRRRDFSFDTRTHDLRAESGGAQHGLSFDDWGRKFVCSNSSHIELVMFDSRYLARNPYLVAPASRRLIADDGGQAEVYRRSPVEPWRIVRTRLRVAGAVPGPVEGGGRAAGYFTGSTGVTIYRGDAWPEEHRGLAFVGDVGSNVVHRKRLVPESVGYRATRIDEKREFLASSEVWFRPAQFANGPDGNLYVLDVYREVIEHPASLPPVIKRHLDLTSGRDRGRIWRVVHETGPRRDPRSLRLDAQDAASLVRALESPNAWQRETAQRLLFEKRDAAAVTALEALVRTSDERRARVHALWTLRGLDALDPELIAHALGDDHPRVREHAVRLAEETRLRSRLFALADDDDLRVRYQLAFTLGEIHGDGAFDALMKIARRDAGDRWVRLAVLSSLADGAGRALAELSRDEGLRKSAGGRELLEKLAFQIGAEGRKESLAAYVRVRDGLDESTRRSFARGLAKSGVAPESLDIDAMVAAARATAVDRDADPGARADAVRTLAFGELSKERETLVELLAPGEAPEVQSAAIATLSRVGGRDAASVILERWSGFSPRVRARAKEALFATDERIGLLLDAIESGGLEARDLGAARLAMLRAHEDPALRSRARKLVGERSHSSRAEVVARYRGALDLDGDAARGRALFEKTCASCHRVGGVGTEIGPNLLAMRARGEEAILLNVLDPNREVNPEFLAYIVLTRDGRALSGLILDESATSVTLRNADGTSETILRLNIRSLKSTGLSFMPEGLEEQLDVQGMADVLEFLTRSP